ncbi:MAG: quinolinate synthase NadA [Sulfurovum sp.]|nr:quinolinate synthase NadA [Sulfurovum sp.]MCB4744455.1 quinolinate synthase NadA [Sulfurovum sp.]MCB4745915.1 quinolinate synthase NadA [Sulfurovum sp.]MCB4748982.1 quinolinate synthase NadA [Sulfurovum sp.]MCB4749849.1 quinolinate synthase NadA [Sulfurovum sp.]
MSIDFKVEIERLKKDLNVTVVAHYYQRDEVFEVADITGDSLELARRCKADSNPWVVFCGVGFMGQSVKVIAPQKRVLMPKIACCAMARMIDGSYFDDSVNYMVEHGIAKDNILPITYINSDATVKAKVGEMGGYVCTSSNAFKIIEKGLESEKKILFVPDRCLGQNFAIQMGLRSCVIGEGECDPKEADIICFNGFCSVHQLFTVNDIEFYRNKYSGIKIAVHPECDPQVVQIADFIGSTSQLIKYVNALDPEQKVAIGTEYNLVNRMRQGNTYVLSSTKPECPTMNETTLEDLYNTLKSIENKEPINEIHVDQHTAKYANLALERMLAIK